MRVIIAALVVLVALAFQQGQQEFSGQIQDEYRTGIVALSEGRTMGGEIKDAIAWFSDNSQITQDEILDELERCVERSGDSCQVDTACIQRVNKFSMGIRYIQDIKDRLESIVDFYTNKGGDCEDFSLFYKAEFNTIADSCGDVTITTWDKAGDETRDLDNEGEWQARGTFTEYEGFEHAYAVCGKILDPNTGKVNGHCIVALSDKKVEGDPSVLEGAVLIEPQNGQSRGLLGEDIKLGDRSAESYIYLIMTDDDELVEKDGNWISYSQLL